MGHAFLSPSGAPAWTLCPAKPWRELGQPESSSNAAEVGTATHLLRAQSITQQRACAEYIGQTLNGITIDAGTAEIVQRAVDIICSFNGEVLVEQALPIGSITGEVDAVGTADTLIFLPGALIVDDYKHGTVRVDAKDNAQLLIYAAAALEQFDPLGTIRNVTMRISQPRIHHESEWTITADEVRYRASEIRLIAERILRGADQVEAVPGDTQCQYCKAKANCGALHEHVMRSVMNDFDTNSDTNIDTLEQARLKPADQISNAQLADCCHSLSLIRSWCDAIEQRALNELAEGNTVPGFKLVAGKRGARTWRDEEEATAVFKSMRLADTEIYTRKLISPTAAEKLLRDSPRKLARLQGLIAQADGKPVIAHETDKRDSITPAASIEMFETIL